MSTPTQFVTVTTKGGLLPPDLLDRISTGRDLDGTDAASYRVIGRRTVTDEAERHWMYLLDVWRELRRELPDTTSADPTGLARGQWLEPLFSELGFGSLPQLGGEGITTDDGSQHFLVSHRWGHVPIHFVDWNNDLESRPASGGAAPHSLMQDCLNRTNAHLWGIVTNGQRLRLLRDSSALAGAAYVEFDLAAIFDAEQVSEFVLLYKLLHVSRFEVAAEAAASACRLERWRLAAITDGVRARDALRDNVAKALRTLGTGFLSHPRNARLLDDLDAERFHKALLRLMYRMLFLFVAEDRGALHSEGADELAVDRYRRYFSTHRLRDVARRRRGSGHDDRYRALRLVLEALGKEKGEKTLALPGLGGIFDRAEVDAILDGLELSNEYLLRAVRFLAVVPDKSSRRNRVVDYRHLGAEELGSVYESLLELVPKYSRAQRSFELVELSGNQRKTTGSYYTPSSLIERLLDTTLDPVIDDAVKRGEQAATKRGTDAAVAIETELLELTVCDPACGSGHFLVASARRIAKRLAAVREGTPEPTPTATQDALRDVIGRCIYGVDINPMAVELAKVALWLEALRPGKALGFLDAHVKCGNALVGALPSLLENGIPDEAWNAIEGDDKKFAADLKKRNRQERLERDPSKHSQPLFAVTQDGPASNVALASGLRRIIDRPADDLAAVHAQEAAYLQWQSSPEYVEARDLADIWCAAFYWHKAADAPPVPTDSVFRELKESNGLHSLTGSTIAAEARRLAGLHGYFHWYLEFPDVFEVPETSVGVGEHTGWRGGFDVVAGNPPWDKVDFEHKKYFASIEPEIANTPGKARDKLITTWRNERPENDARYVKDRRGVKATFNFASNSQCFPLCAKGLTIKGVNSLATDQLFVELNVSIGAASGRAGCIVPTAIATGAGAQHLFKSFTERGAISSLFDFDNPQRKFFPGVDSRQKFCLLSFVGQDIHEPNARFAFFVHGIEELDAPKRTFTLTPEDLAIINPNTGTLPIFENNRNEVITSSVYQRLPVLKNESEGANNAWDIGFKNLFNVTDDSGLFRKQNDFDADTWRQDGNVFSRKSERMLPFYEAKMIDFFNHRSADVIVSETALNRKNQPRYLTSLELKSPSRLAQPLNWIDEQEVFSALPTSWSRPWLFGWCDVTSSTNERTSITSFLPRTAVGHTFPLMFLPNHQPAHITALCAAQSSFVFDFVSRQKVSDAHMKLFVWKQLPVPTPKMLTPHLGLISTRVLELTYTAYDMTPFARDLDDDDEPFIWDDDRRAVMRAELDALFFHLYGIERDDVDYIMETFPIVKKKDIEAHGSYLTKERILAIYDRMATVGVDLEAPAIDGANFTSELDPPPGKGPRHPAHLRVTGHSTEE